jgi:hypothetical protein
MDLVKFTKNIVNTVRERSIGYCAKNVREALENADGIITKIPLYPRDYEPVLLENDYVPLVGLTIDDYIPQNGDIIIWKKNNASKAGHIQVYVKENESWYSDFKQHSIFPNFKFSHVWINGGYMIYRHVTK